MADKPSLYKTAARKTTRKAAPAKRSPASKPASKKAAAIPAGDNKPKRRIIKRAPIALPTPDFNEDWLTSEIDAASGENSTGEAGAPYSAFAADARERINKYISDRGVCSRRDADLWVESGRITINETLAQMGDSVGPADQVRVDGELLGLNAKPKRVYIALNKPTGVECTTNLEVGGNIVDFIGHSERIFPIGRLDKDSDGLILLTNDGDIVNKILRKEYQHEKEYVVTVDRKLEQADLTQMSQGVQILNRTTKPCKTFKLGAKTFNIVLTEGMNRQIRRMADAFGYHVQRLTRVRVLNIGIGHLKLGKWRNLTQAEIIELRKRLDGDIAPLPTRKPGPKSAGESALEVEKPLRAERPKVRLPARKSVVIKVARTGKAPAGLKRAEKLRKQGAKSAPAARERSGFGMPSRKSAPAKSGFSEPKFGAAGPRKSASEKSSASQRFGSTERGQDRDSAANTDRKLGRKNPNIWADKSRPGRRAPTEKPAAKGYAARKAEMKPARSFAPRAERGTVANFKGAGRSTAGRSTKR